MHKYPYKVDHIYALILRISFKFNCGIFYLIISHTLLFLDGHRFWMGVELDMPTGKNDGSRNGVRYFKCQPRHGMFVLQSKVKLSTAPHHSKRVGASRTPGSSGTESADYTSMSGSVSLVTSGASEAEMTSPSPYASPATSGKRLGASSSNSK